MIITRDIITRLTISCVLLSLCHSLYGQQTHDSSTSNAEKYAGKMIDIPGGIFMMGSNSGADDEKPIHQVRIEPFSMGQYEVTWSQYQPCIDEGVCPDNSADGGDNGWGKGSRPVIEVSFEDISRHFIPWLKSKTGSNYRLPTEAEWEYAARAGSTSEYSWGDEVGINNANCDGCGSQWSAKSTSPVGSFKPNAFGLYDMHGNVWEWTSGCWSSNYENITNTENSRNPSDCNVRSLRGGSWFGNHVSARSAERGWMSVNSRFDCSGFRLVKEK